MPDLTNEVEQVVRDGAQQRAADAELVRLRDFLKEMRSRGLVVKKGYGIPLMDTIGFPLYVKP
jgi:hypothetical protein